MVDLCQLPPLPIETEESVREPGYGDVGGGYVADGVVAAVVTGMSRDGVSWADMEGEESAEDFAGWRCERGWVRQAIPAMDLPVVTPAGAEREVVAVVDDSGLRAAGEVRALAKPVAPGRAAPPQVWRRRREPVVDPGRGVGRLAAPLVLLCSAVVSMVLLSLASIGVVRDMGSTLPERVRPAVGVVKPEAVVTEVRPVVTSPAIAGSANAP